jgi:hypothetical protein
MRARIRQSTIAPSARLILKFAAMISEQFSYRITKDGRVRVAFHGRHVVTVSRRPAARLSAQLDGANPERVQLLLAQATGNFKRGNERHVT